MFAPDSSEFSEAVLFIEAGRVSREMLYSEFEAVLDGVVPITALAGKTAQAVYLRVNRQLLITAAVFFRIPFDSDGNADRRWNVPIQQFAEQSARGPDLGAGPIRLACHSQCSIAWQQRNLWDPDMTPGRNTFLLLRKAIKANRLGLPYRDEAEEPPVLSVQQAANLSVVQEREIESRLTQQLRGQIEQEFRDHVARLLKEQRLRILTLNSRRKHEIQQLQLRHQQRLQEYRLQLEQRQHELQLLEQRNAELKDTIETQANKIAGLREYFEHKLRSAQLDESTQLKAMQQNYEAELEAKVQAAVLELREKLQLKEIELMYRSEQEASLEREIRRLRQENQLLLQQSGEQLLERLEKAGVSFVAYHPGAGHLTIPLADMSPYLADPQAYAADKCGVERSHYQAWLTHYEQPLCRELQADGEFCGRPVEQIDSPSDFHPGEHDRCQEHRQSYSEEHSSLRAEELG